MKVTYITAGAGAMHCGACSRDAALARALIARGCDVLLIPLYTPINVEDGPPPGTTRTFFGGINVYLQQHVPLFRHTPRLVDRFLDNRPLLNWAGKFAIKTKAEKLGPMTVSMLRGEEGRQRKELARLLDFLAGGPAPDVVNLANSLLSGIVPALRRRIKARVACTLQGEDQFIEDIPEPDGAQVRDLLRRNVREIDLFIAPSDAYADHMAGFLDVPREKVRTVRTGIEVDRYPPPPRRPRRPFAVGYLSRITPEKGLDLLVEAFRTLVLDGREAVLRVAGQTPDARFWDTVRADLRRPELAARVEHCDVPDLPAKVRFFQACSAVSVPSRRPEVRGTAAIEAMAAGVPVVVPRSGVFPELIETTGGGVLFPPGDAERLAAALAGLMDDPDGADALGLAGREGARVHCAAARMAQRTSELYTDLIEGTN